MGAPRYVIVARLGVTWIVNRSGEGRIDSRRIVERLDLS